MQAAWDWHMPRETPEQERELVEFTADLGFDTLIVRDPSENLVDWGHDHGLDVVAIVGASPSDEFAGSNPDCVQRLHPAEENILTAIEDVDDYYRFAHQRFPYVHGRDLLCFEREPSKRFLEKRVSEALEVADGVAFDGFGFRNHYACFCEACERRRNERAASTDDEYDALRDVSGSQLVDISERLYDHAKGLDSDAIVTNHVWPPFAPDPYYGHRLSLDYCSQTISWFYRPDWSLDRVEFEAAEHARLAGTSNEFVPFIGLYADPSPRRSPDRVASELEIASGYGDDHLVFCTLEAPANHAEYADVLRDALD